MDVREEAYKDWAKGMKRKEIAEKHNIKIETLKSWITRDFKKRGAPKNKKGAPSKKAKGGQVGNKNSVGHEGKTAPRNKNAEKHGAYSAIYWDTLDEDELALLEAMSYDEEQELEQQIALLAIRERRLLQQIQKFRKIQDQTINSTTSRELKIKGCIEKGEEQEHSETTIKTSPTLDFILKLEATLTQVQARKTQCISSLHKIRSDRQDRAEREEEKEQELGANAIDDVIIYMPEKGEVE